VGGVKDDPKFAKAICCGRNRVSIRRQTIIGTKKDGMKTIQAPPPTLSRALALAGLLALPTLSACVAAGPPPPPRVVTEADAGLVQLARGQALEVRLPSNAGTGHAWRLDQEAPAWILSGGSSHDTAARPAPPGGPVTTVYAWRGVGRGKTDLSFTFKRAWEPDSPSDRKVVFQVRVR
jgi:inhibitor of cysteine peptidase